MDINEIMNNAMTDPGNYETPKPIKKNSLSSGVESIIDTIKAKKLQEEEQYKQKKLYDEVQGIRN